MRLALALAMAAAVHTAALADVVCAPPPQQTAADVKKSIETSARGLLSSRNVVQTIETSAKNLYAAYPNADQVVIKLSYLNVACQIVRDSNWSPARKLKWFLAFQSAALNTRNLLPERPAVKKRAVASGRDTAGGTNPDYDPRYDPIYAAYAMNQKQAEASVTADEAHLKPWCVPAFPDQYVVVLSERDRFLYLSAARQALEKHGEVKIVGYEFETGMSTAYGLGFSGRRARAVADLLVGMGIPQQKLSVDWVANKGSIETIGTRYCAAIIS